MSLRSFSIAPFNRNAVLQLIAANGTGFVIYKLIWVCFIVFNKPQNKVGAVEATNLVAPYVALSSLQHFASQWWTLFTYNWVHAGFFEWVSNMLWLYCFGTIIQSLVGYRQVIPIFVYGSLGGALFCLLGQLLPFGMLNAGQYVMTAEAGVMALAAAALVLAPSFRIYLGDRFSIPLVIVIAVYLAFNLASFGAIIPLLVLCLGGLASGAVYSLLFNKGYRPGEFAYRLIARISSFASPDPVRPSFSGTRRSAILANTPPKKKAQPAVDDILDKINVKGYASLTQLEKDILMKASQEHQD